MQYDAIWVTKKVRRFFVRNATSQSDHGGSEWSSWRQQGAVEVVDYSLRYGYRQFRVNCRDMKLYDPQLQYWLSQST
jgi:hypothetical protein